MALFTTETGKAARAKWQQKYQRTFEERLWSKIEKHGPDECWPWIGNRTKRGYGMIHALDGGSCAAHRRVWILLNGPVGPKIEICHKCDNPSCCNPNHLFAGTHKENMQDAIKKGRFVFVRGGDSHGVVPPRLRGIESPMHKLTDEQVLNIRKEFATGSPTVRGLGKRYGVSGSTIGAIVRGRTWTHLNSEWTPTQSFAMRRVGERHANSKFTENDIRNIRKQFDDGVTQTAIAIQFGVPQGTISNIILRKSWTHI